jgi:hypothetical protein
MYEKEMYNFRKKIINNVENKLENGNINIQQSNNSLILNKQSSNLDLYKKKLEEQKQFFGGSIKHNIIKDDTTLFKKKDEDVLIDSSKITNVPINLTFCLDENYRDNFICLNVLKEQNYFLYSNLFNNLISLYLFNKEKNINIPVINNLFLNNKRNNILDDKSLKDISLDNQNVFENNIKDLNFNNIYKNERISFSNNLIDILLFMINDEIDKSSTDMLLLDNLKLNCVIDVGDRLNELEMNNKFDITITNLQKKEIMEQNNDEDYASNICFREELKNFTINIKDYDKINNTINVLSKLYVIYDILLGNKQNTFFTTSNKNPEGLLDIKKFILDRRNSDNFISLLLKKLDLLLQHLINFEKYIGLDDDYTNKQILIKKINKIKNLLEMISKNINTENIELKINEIYKLISKIQRNKNSYYNNFKSLKSVLDTISTVCDHKQKKREKLSKLSTIFDNPLKEKYVSIYKDYFKTKVLQNYNKKIFIVPIVLTLTHNYKYNNCNALLLIKKENSSINSTLYILKGDIDLNINGKVYETNIFYDYTLFENNISKQINNNILELLKGILSSVFSGMSIKLELAEACNKRINDLFSLNKFINEQNDLILSNDNKKNLNLIKNEYFYLENFNQALYDFKNLENKLNFSNKISYKKHLENLYEYDILKHGNIKNKIENLKNEINESNKNHVINLFLNKIFSVNKLNYTKYKIFMDIINLYINNFMNDKIELKNININNMDFLTDSFINKLLFSKNMSINEYKNINTFKNRLLKEIEK